jgi:hypothetical protein
MELLKLIDTKTICVLMEVWNNGHPATISCFNNIKYRPHIPLSHDFFDSIGHPNNISIL